METRHHEASKVYFEMSNMASARVARVVTLTIECKLELPKHIGKKLSTYIVVVIMVVKQFTVALFPDFPHVCERWKAGQGLGTRLVYSTSFEGSVTNQTSYNQ